MDATNTFFTLNEILPSRDFQLKVNGEEVFVYHTEVANFAVIESDQPEVDVEVINTSINPTFHVMLRPLSLKVKPEVQDDGDFLRNRRICFKLPVPCRASLEIDGRLNMPLFLFAYDPEKDLAGRDEAKIRRYAPGVHEVGNIELGDGETLVLEKGAYVHGNVIARGDDILVCGRGVLSGERYPRRQRGTPPKAPMNSIYGDNCKNLTVRDVTLVDCPVFHVMPCGCDGVTLERVNVIGRVRSGDGIDLCGSVNVLIDGCFVRVHDDCICLKGYNRIQSDVYNIVAQNCVLFNWEGGNGIEIGYETCCGEIRNVTFRNIDIIHSLYEGLGSGGAITIHNGDRAHVHDVLYDDIRVEDAKEKFLDIKMLTSTWNQDAMCGPVTDITFRNVRVVEGPFPPSIIHGFDFNHMIHRIRFINLSVLGKQITAPGEGAMICELAQDVTFEVIPEDLPEA